MMKKKLPMTSIAFAAAALGLLSASAFAEIVSQPEASDEPVSVVSSDPPAPAAKPEGTPIEASDRALTVEVASISAPVQPTGSNLLVALNAGGTDTVLVSPTSVRAVLEMLLPGAPEEVRARYGTFEEPRVIPGVTEANALWLDKGFDAKDAFIMAAAARAHVERIDFATQGAGPINAWVEKATGGRISQLLGDLSPATEMVATNALLFKGSWREAFDPEQTMAGDFHTASGEIVGADFMKAKARPVMRLGGGAATRLEVEGGMQLVFFLPDDGINTAVAAATLEQAAFSSSEAFEGSAPVMLPRFMLEDTNSMSDALRAIGLDFVLDASFDGIAASGPRISTIVQKVAVEIDEAGASAAAATAAVVNRSLTIEPEPLVFDRPFWFAITESNPQGASSMLFAGYVASPHADGGSHE